MTRFFSSYGESPHLQAIEDSYLMYLEQQHAKESHLKAVKRFQIMHALKTLQRFWKRKYAEIRLRCLIMIQRNSKAFIRGLRLRNLRLQHIRKRLLAISLKQALLLFIKKRRISKNRVIHPNILSIVKIQDVRRLQGLVRGKISRNQARFQQSLQMLRLKQMVIKHCKLRTLVSRINREKETYFLQRYAFAKVEVDQIMKYIQKTEEKFELNWVQYEKSLEQYLTSNGKQYKDWIQKKDDMGNHLWFNMKTLKEQFEHPGKSIFIQNNRLLKKKAEDELRDNFKPIYERRMLILETIFEIKGKIAKDFKKSRSQIVFKKEDGSTAQEV